MSNHLRSKYYFCYEIWKIYNKEFYKKIDLPDINFFFEHSINMPNPQQKEMQNEIERIRNEINLLQDRLKKNGKKKKKRASFKMS